MNIQQQAFDGYKKVFQFGLFTLPYLYYGSLFAIFIVLVFLVKTFRKTAIDPLMRHGLILISGLFLLSAAVAFNKGEAFLQLSNFLPFFIFFALLPFVLNNTKTLEEIALGLVISTIPINLISLPEYILKSPQLPRPLRSIDIVAEIRSAPHIGRAMVMFDHPNTLANYLVLILGLGLGLILNRVISRQQQLPEPDASSISNPWIRNPGLLYAGTYLNLLGIFCSGSRNGMIVAISQLIVFSVLIKARRFLWLTGLVGMAAIALVTLLGIGGRTISLSALSSDPRVGVWKIALDLIRVRPWLGWGLGNYKLLYPDRLIDPEHPYIAHAHNIWLMLACEAGIPVAIALTLWVGYIIYQAMKGLIIEKLAPATRTILLGYLLAFWGAIAFALFDITFYDARINVLNWVILAGIYSLTKPDR